MLNSELTVEELKMIDDNIAEIISSYSEELMDKMTAIFLIKRQLDKKLKDTEIH